MVRLISIAVLALSIIAVAGNSRAGGEVSDYYYPAKGAEMVVVGVPSFTSKEGNLGLNVATILGMQVFTTFRKADEEQHAFFGDALVLWSPEKMAGATHQNAEQWGSKQSCRLVLWGDVVPYAGHVVVQAQLTVLPSAASVQPEVIELFIRGQKAQFRVPTTRYNFTPLVLKQEVVDKYKDPGALRLHSKTGGRGTDLGSVGPAFKALISTPENVQVQSSSRKVGWLNLPLLASNKSEVSDFISGLVRVFRGDYGGAKKYLSAVIDNPESGITVKADAHLYLAIAAYQVSEFAAAQVHVRQARTLDPFGAGATSAVLFLALRDAVTGRDPGSVRLKEALSASRGIVPDDDPLVRLATAIAGK